MILPQWRNPSIEKVHIDVFTRSVQPDTVTAVYGQHLEQEKVDIDPIRGATSYKIHEDFLRIVARPEKTSVDAAEGRILALRWGPRAERYPGERTEALVA